VSPWIITVVILTSTAATVVVNLILFGFRAGEYNERFKNHGRALDLHTADIEQLGKEITLLKIRLAAATGKTNGG
jgi:hypothetical protein